MPRQYDLIQGVIIIGLAIAGMLLLFILFNGELLPVLTR